MPPIWNTELEHAYTHRRTSSKARLTVSQTHSAVGALSLRVKSNAESEDQACMPTPSLGNGFLASGVSVGTTTVLSSTAYRVLSVSPS